MKYKFEFTARELSIINDALMNAPYGVVATLIDNINKAIRSQEAARANAAQAEESKEV